MQLTLTTTRDPRTEVEVVERHHSASLDLPSFVPKPKLEANSNDALIVSQLFDQNSGSWNLQKLRDLFDEHALEAIQKVLIPSHSQVDNWIWTATNLGEITVKPAYWICCSASPPLAKILFEVLFGILRFMID